MLTLITNEQIGIETTYQANWDKKHHKCSTKICYSRYITKTNCGHGNLVIKLHNEIMKLWIIIMIIILVLDKSITYSQRIFAAYAESGHFLVDHYTAKKKQKCPNTLSTIPQLIMNCLFWIMYHITASQIQACGKDKIAQYVLLPSSLPFSFAGHFLHFISVGKVFLPNPEDSEIILKEVQVWVLVKEDFHWNFLIIII